MLACICSSQDSIRGSPVQAAEGKRIVHTVSQNSFVEESRNAGVLSSENLGSVAYPLPAFM